MGYVTSDQPGSLNKKITLKIKNASSASSIVLGMGMPKKDKEFGFIYSIFFR
jgi:hypothetical protein